MTTNDTTDAQKMEDFTTNGPAVLRQVMAALRRVSSEQGHTIDQLSVDPFSLTDLPSDAPGAFELLGSPLQAGGDATTPDGDQSHPGLAGVGPGSATQPNGQSQSGTTDARTGSTTSPATAAAAAPGQPDQAEAETAPSLSELLAELDGLIGLESVKQEIHRQSAILRIQGLRHKAGLKDPTVTRHLVFVGNPGTGKTTVARLVGGIYRALGLLSKGHLVEVDRSELVAGYLGQTAIKTAEVLAKAAGGVLFIDEAYALSGDQYGQESINTLVKEMEDRRGDLVVIVAGYPGPMEQFIAENPGLESRFRTTIVFPDYTDDELTAILTSMAHAADFDLPEASVRAFRALLALQVRDENFGNGRFVRNVFEAAIGKMAWRLKDVAEPTLEQLRQILPQDISPTPQESTPTEPVDEEDQSGSTDDESTPTEPVDDGESLSAEQADAKPIPTDPTEPMDLVDGVERVETSQPSEQIAPGTPDQAYRLSAPPEA